MSKSILRGFKTNNFLFVINLEGKPQGMDNYPRRIPTVSTRIISADEKFEKGVPRK